MVIQICRGFARTSLRANSLKKYITVFFHLLAVVILLCIHTVSFAKPYTVLAVMSYEENYPWTMDIMEGITSIFSNIATVTPFYMNTKIDFAGGPQMGKKAYHRYLELQPDGVIAADDNAQSMFVVPYLKDRVSTPVMFCGVNSDPDEYGYPATNVSGILERLHFTKSTIMAKQLIPGASTLGFIMQAGPSAEKIILQLHREKHRFPVQFIAAKTPRTVTEALSMTKQLRETCDLLFMETLQGLKSDDGRPIEYSQIMPLIAKTFGKTVIASDDYAVRHGALCGVVKTGQEQGRTAAKMLLQAMQGKEIKDLPITRNLEGKRMINVTIMRRMGLSPPPELIHSSELVKEIN